MDAKFDVPREREGDKGSTSLGGGGAERAWKIVEKPERTRNIAKVRARQERDIAT